MIRLLSLTLLAFAAGAQPALLFSPADRDRVLELARQQPWPVFRS